VPKIGVIFPPNRPPYEMCYLSDLSKVSAKAILDESARPVGAHPNVETVFPGREGSLFPDPVLRRVVSPVKYSMEAAHLDDVDAIVSMEAYSFTTNRMIRLARKIGAKSFVLAWETLPNHPLYAIPPFSTYAGNAIHSADGFIAATDLALRHLQALGAERSKSARVYPGVDTMAFKPSVKGEQGPSRVMLYVGLLAKHKGFDLVLRAYQSLRKSDERLQLWVVGDGPLRGLLSLDLGRNVRYFGYLTRDRLPEVYSGSTVFITLPRAVKKLGIKTWEEQFGFTVAEAMSTGLPVVSTGCGAIRELLGNDNPLVEEGDLNSAVKAVKGILNDPQGAVDIGIRNRRRIEASFDEKRQSRAFEEFLVSHIAP
jgi:glycosyltransferase involved in cell wall biosynthesis